MASRSDDNQTAQILARAVRDAIAAAAPVRQFGRLKDSFRYIANSRRVVIYSIYYWTRFFNDGRKAIDGPLMIFFRDPDDDPRIQDDYPQKRATRRRLTKQELRTARENDEVIVTRSVASASPERFIEEGIRSARQIVPPVVLGKIQGDVRSLLRRRRDKITVVI